MEYKLIQGDITEIKADVIVNAANTSLLGGSGVDGAIHKKGGKAILEACQKIRARQGKCNVGQAVITTAGNLSATYVIHTVGPVWNKGGEEKEQLLRDCYINSMHLAIDNKVQSIAFPCISTGIYKFPKDIAAKIAVDTIKNFKNQQTIDTVIFVCYDAIDFKVYQNILTNET